MGGQLAKFKKVLEKMLRRLDLPKAILQNKDTMRVLIDRFNKMVKSVADGFPHVRFVDLRGTLPNGTTYKHWWANELHPTKDGFEAVAARFADAIAKA